MKVISPLRIILLLKFIIILLFFPLLSMLCRQSRGCVVPPKDNLGGCRGVPDNRGARGHGWGYSVVLLRPRWELARSTYRAQLRAP